MEKKRVIYVDMQAVFGFGLKWRNRNELPCATPDYYS